MNETSSPLHYSPHSFLSDDPSSQGSQLANLNFDSDDNDNNEDNDDNSSETKTDDEAKEQSAYEAYRDNHPEKDQLNIGAREIDDYETIWSVSSFRPGWGVDKLRDHNPLTYWQSDVSTTKRDHAIDISFHQATLVNQVSIFIDYFQDQTYTPKTISIRGGNTYRDLQDLATIDCPEWVSWVNIDLSSHTNGNLFRIFKLQIAILSTHANGRDIHIRQVKLYSLSSHMQDKTDHVKRKANLGRGLR